MAIFDNYFPEQPSYMTGLLGEDEALKARQQAQQAGLLNTGLGLLMASGPSTQRQGLGQILAQGIMSGQQAYQGAYDKQLKDKMTSFQVQDMLDKMSREKQFRSNIAGAMVKRPTSTGLTQTGVGSQAEMLSRPEFGGDFGQETVGALMSNPNLPQTTALDQNKFMTALAQYSPLEFAKLSMKTEDKPDALKTFEAFSKMNPAQQQQFLQFKQSSAPTTVLSLAEKGADKVIGERIGEFSSAAATQRRFAQDADTINTLLVGKGGGEVVKVGTELAKNLGLKNEQITAQDLANSIAIRGATTMRAPGSGATSDLEFRAYQNAFPSLSNSEEGRKFMAQASRDFAKRSAKLSDFAMKLYKENRFSEEAIAAYDESLGKVLDEEKMNKLSGGKTGRRSF
jgi:hypothetical protein